ncbi:MAG TPA: histidine kinase [Verrucomicrobiae bacterium]
MPKAGLSVTNVAQFRILSGADYLEGCNFNLTGVVTLVDTTRDLVVLQDTTGSVALNFPMGNRKLQVGQLVTIDGTNCCPLFSSFPDYPCRPSGWDICSSFETPSNWGEYNLTRMRGCVHPDVTGDYIFWIASDNSSELWLSTDENPSEARQICSVPRFGWVAPHEWSKFSTQRSEPIHLEAGKKYYIEALQEQTTIGENLSVAWQGPGMSQSVIDDKHLIPEDKTSHSLQTATNGILREYWTNYPDGDLTGLGGPRPFESALTIKNVGIRIEGQGQLPNPEQIDWDQPLAPEANYRWVQAEGLVTFKATDGNTTTLELSDGRTLIRVKTDHWNQDMASSFSNLVVRVNGVCEGVRSQDGTVLPGLIWASASNSVSFVKALATNTLTLSSRSLQPVVTNNPSMPGFYGMHGVVTFNDRVFGKDYLFVQQDNTVVLLYLGTLSFQKPLEVGEDVDLGGTLEPGQYLSGLSPLFVTEQGWHSMPTPIAHPLSVSASASLDGRWSELDCVVHSVNPNGTLSVAGKDGAAYLWLGQTPRNDLAGYVDAKLRVRGVLMLNLLDDPALLVPSRSFVNVEEEARSNPFDAPRSWIAGLPSDEADCSSSHRILVAGEVTYQDDQSFFIQDDSGGVRVQTRAKPKVTLGEAVEVVAFPALNGLIHALTDPLVRPARSMVRVSPKDLDLNETLPPKQDGSLVNVSATLLGHKTNGMNQVLELQGQQHMFVATLLAGGGTLPNITTGSELQVTGVYDDEPTISMPADAESGKGQPYLASPNILLRSPKDVVVLAGPPWWTLKRTVTLVGALLTVLVVSLLWVHLLRRRLERQQASRLAFSRQILQGQENERQRIAANLHDSLGQNLLVIKNQAELAMQTAVDESARQDRLGKISEITSQAIEEVRRITHGLRPYQLDRLGLTQAIRASVNHASETNPILFASRVEDIDGLFNKEAEIHVYRIVQEAITNVVKHAAATEAAVVIKKRASIISISIRDNGRGFDPARPTSEPHDLSYGLNGISERVRILKGDLAIDSRPGEGASLTIEIPLSIPEI